MTDMYVNVCESQVADECVDYPGRVTHGSAAAEERPEGTPWIRNPEFVRYLNRQIALERDQGRPITELARNGNISRQSFNRWRGIGGPQTIPDADNLIEFCEANGWDVAEPMHILGWTTPVLGTEQLRQALADVKAALADPNLTVDDAAEFAELLNILAAQLRARAQRNMD